MRHERRIVRSGWTRAVGAWADDAPDAAVGRLDAAGGLTAAQRRTVARMTERITETLVTSPTAALLSAEHEAAVATALELFGEETGPE